jgi:hypothetical protein
MQAYVVPVTPLLARKTASTRGCTSSSKSGTDAPVRDGKEAVEYARKACEATGGKNPFYPDTLAAAYAEAGGFQEAAKVQQQALRSADLVGQYGEKPRERLQLYKESKPYREQ